MPNIYQVGGFGFDSNIYLILDEIITLVDAGTGQNQELVERNLMKFDISPKDIDLLINTHCHFDHAGGDRAFLEAAGCELAIHELDAEPLRTGDETVTLAADFGTHFEPLEPTRILHEGDQIKLGSLTLEIFHTPGHTRGSISLYERKNQVLFSGDTVFCDGIGRTDLPTGDAGAMAKSLQRLAGLKIRELLPGHGRIERKNAGERLKTVLKFAKPYLQSNASALR